MPTLESRSEEAIRALAWHGVIQFTLKTLDREIRERSAATVIWPETYLPSGSFLHSFSATIGSVKPSTDPGAYRNRAAVVYTVVILEDFLREAYRATFSREPPTRFGDIGGELEDRFPSIRSDPCDHGVNFLNKIRVRIVHHGGELDEDAKERLRQYRSRAIWPDSPVSDGADFDEDFQVPVICLDISKVVIPGIRDAIRFVRLIMDEIKKTCRAETQP